MNSALCIASIVPRVKGRSWTRSLAFKHLHSHEREKNPIEQNRRNFHGRQRVRRHRCQFHRWRRNNPVELVSHLPIANIACRGGTRGTSSRERQSPIRKRVRQPTGEMPCTHRPTRRMGRFWPRRLVTQRMPAPMLPRRASQAPRVLSSLPLVIDSSHGCCVPSRHGRHERSLPYSPLEYRPDFIIPRSVRFEVARICRLIRRRR